MVDPKHDDHDLDEDPPGEQDQSAREMVDSGGDDPDPGLTPDPAASDVETTPPER